jgi:hypothetical protein
MPWDGDFAICDRCGDIDGAQVMAAVEGLGVLCWHCARDLDLYHPPTEHA